MEKTKRYLLEFIGWLSAILFLAMYIPQLQKLIHSEELSGFSVHTWIIYAIALGLSALYLWCQNEKAWPVIVNQSLSCLLCLVLIIVYYFRL